MKNKKVKLLEVKKKPPLVGNNRSFSNKASKRIFRGNVQNFKIAGKKYKITARTFRSYFSQLNRQN